MDRGVLQNMQDRDSNAKVCTCPGQMSHTERMQSVLCGQMSEGLCDTSDMETVRSSLQHLLLFPIC